MTDQSQFDSDVAAATRPRKAGFIAALVLGLILGGGLMALWKNYGSAPLGQPQAGVAAHASDETTQAIKDFQTTEQRIWPASVSPIETRLRAGRDQTIVRPSYRIER